MNDRHSQSAWPVIYRQAPRAPVQDGQRRAAEVGATRTLVGRIKAKLGVTPASIAADKAYGNGALLGWLLGTRGRTSHVRRRGRSTDSRRASEGRDVMQDIIRKLRAQDWPFNDGLSHAELRAFERSSS